MATTSFWRGLGLLSFAALPVSSLSVSSLHAQEQQPSADAGASPRANDIVVTGRTAKDRRAIERQAHAITLDGADYRTPLAQFQDPVCPGVIGLPVDMALIVIDRIRYNAERIGLRTAKEENCQANILVAFVKNGQTELKALTRKSSYLFRDVTHAEIDALLADPGPVHAWSNTSVLSRQGDILQGDSDLGQIPVLNVAQSQSHIFLAHRIDITKSVVMMDLAAVNGLSVVQLADYATMRGFARTRAIRGESAADTILGLFDPAGSKPMEMTGFDLAYLRSIYGGIPNLTTVSKLAGINREMRKLDQTDGEKPASKP